MNKIFPNFLKAAFLVACFTGSFSVFSQSPDRMNYQAALRDDAGEILAEEPVVLRLSILEDNPAGAPVYSEAQEATTSAQGLVNLQIGAGTDVTGDFSTINWAAGPYFLKVELSEGGGFTTLGSSQLLSVPYALYSNKAGSADTAAVLANMPWFLNGNDGIDTTHFIGTVNDQDLVFKTNNERNMVLEKNGNFFVGDSGVVETLVAGGGFNIHGQGGLYFNKNNFAIRGGLIVDSTHPGQGYFGNYPYTTMGYFQEDSLGYGSIGLGIGNIAMGPANVALGIHNKVIAHTTGAQPPIAGIAIGSNNLTKGNYSVAIGHEAEAQEGGIAIGNSPFSGSSDRPIAIGNNAVALGGAHALNMGAFAAGSLSQATGYYSTAIGMENTAGGVAAVSLGYGNISNAIASLAIGRYNDSLIAPESANMDNAHPAFMIGNGDGATRSNALVVYFNGNATLAGTLTQNSDRRLKKEIAPLTPVLGKVEALEGVRYRWNGLKGHDTSNIQLGLIAQDLEKIFPELVTTEANGYKSVNYIGLVPVLVEAVKELKTKLTAKESQIDTLKADNEAAIKNLEHKMDRILAQLEEKDLAGR